MPNVIELYYSLTKLSRK